MQVHDLIEYLNNHKNAKQIISKGKFKKLFIVGDVGDDGNCLFYSIEYLLSNKSAAELRRMVCEYYKKFNVNKEYPEYSLDAQIKFNMLYDNVDNDGSMHSKNICKNLKWASVMDVVTLAEMLGINIILFSFSEGDGKNKLTKGYIMQEYIYKPTAETICIKYNGRDHFQPLVPMFSMNSPVKSSASNTPSPINYLSEAPDVSPETLRALGYNVPLPNKKSPKSNGDSKKFSIKQFFTFSKNKMNGGTRRKKKRT